MKTKSTIFLSFFIVLATLCTKTKAQAVNVQDSLALVDLYNSTNGPGWTNNTNWLKKLPVSTWYGISVTDNRVTEINLYFNALRGNIPASIGTLSNLTYLYFGYNQLTGSIPPEIGNLINLNSLWLNNNHLGGSIPSELGKLVNLTDLYLQNDSLIGSIPPELGNLSNLNYLLLTNNGLTGKIPPELGNLSNLTQLGLGDNYLSGKIPRELGNLPIIYWLLLNGNKLSGNIPAELGNLSSLQYLFLNDNRLSGSIPPQLGNFLSLKSLELDRNQLSGAIPSSVGNLNGTSIRLSYNRFTFDGMELIAKRGAKYRRQANIPIHQNGNTLYISAGGTLSNNTYKWFMVGQTDSTTIVGDSVFTPTENGKYYAAVTNSICTQLTLYTDTVYYDATLPVTIINLKAYKQGSIIKVDWASLTEINVARYEVQRSSNAVDFTTVGSLPAKGNGTQETDYTFNDMQPLQGDNYYRLKAVDKDGKITYTKTVLVNVNDKTITIVYPIPAKDILHVKTNGNTSFSLVNQTGKTLLTTNINGNGTINVSGLGEGLYYLKNNSNGVVQKIIIAR